MKILQSLEINGAFLKWFKRYKDRAFLPVAKLCLKLGITPNMVTAVGFIFGIASVGALLFINYWYFSVLAIISVLLDGLDGVLARLRNEQNGFGKQFDFAVDLTIMILTYWALTVWLQEPWWIIWLDLYGVMFVLNLLSGKKVGMIPGRAGLALFAAIGFPKFGFFLVALIPVLGIPHLIHKLITGAKQNS